MNNEENLLNMKKIRNGLLRVKSQIRTVNDIVNQSITINGDGVKNNDISIISTKLDHQMDNLEKKIIFKIENM